MNPGGGFTVFVPGHLQNHLNRPAHWAKVNEYRSGWHQRVTAAIVTETHAHGWATSPEWATVPKEVWLVATVWNLYDEDGLSAALKPVLDALVKNRVLHTDAPESGHVVYYGQRQDRRKRGVTIEVRER